jgi:hypothetical protein
MKASSSAIGKTRFHVRPILALVIRAKVIRALAIRALVIRAQAIRAQAILLQLHALQAILVSKLSLAMDVKNSSIAGMDRNKVAQLHAHRAHSSMKDFRSVTGPAKLLAMFE